MPKFSLLMGTKNRRDFIRQQVAAILAQDYEDWELIVEDATPDGVFDLLPCDPRILYIHDERSRNLSEALNVAMAVSRGRIFMRCDDDDQIAPGTLRWVAENIGEAWWGYGRMLWNGEPNGQLCTYEELLHANYIPCPAVFWTREAADRIGPWNVDTNCAEDYDYWLRLMYHFKPKYTDRIMSVYGDHPAQATKTKSAESEACAQQIRRLQRLRGVVA